MSSRRWIETARRWFLGLPQLQKTLVFGGLGLLSGWVTTAIVVMSYRGHGIRGAAFAAFIVPGPVLWCVVIAPTLVWGKAALERWIWSLLIVPLLFPAAFAALLASATTTPAGPLQSWRPLPVAVVGGSFGYALAICSMPRAGLRNFRAVDASVWCLALVSVLIAWVETRLEPGIPGLPSLIVSVIRWAIFFVTLNSAVAVSLSFREWPASDANPASPTSVYGWATAFSDSPQRAIAQASPPPPLDDSATLPP